MIEQPHHHDPYYHDHYQHRQYQPPPPTERSSTPESVFNYDQKSSFDLSNSGYLLTLLLLGKNYS